MNNEGFISKFLVYGVYGLRETRRQIPKYLSFGGQIDTIRHQDTKGDLKGVLNSFFGSSNARKTKSTGVIELCPSTSTKRRGK